MMKNFLLLLTLLTTGFTALGQADDPWSVYMTPAVVHQLLAGYTGNFELEITLWMAPGQEPVVMKIGSTNSMILGGRFLEMKQAGKLMDMDYQAVTTLGYNTIDQHFALTTLTNIGTGTLALSGIWNEQTKVAQLKGTLTNPVSRGQINVRQQLTFTDKNHFLIENFDQEGAEPERKTMQYKLTRKP